ncbi:conserved membrane hypothetical protein [uncultured Paludibacter sp.]|nr:conserved membrane hypothetical protein [uncultured Paludibacter sp.]
MKKFRLLNNIFGWLTFAIAAITYLTTIEPTGSFWDCGEFVSSAYKLNVGHPPGAPFFMLMGKFFSLFASHPSQVAAMVNSFSALCSAFTILFLFWTITHLARKIVAKSEEEYTTANIIGILGAGMVGALAYTFSDTFWFSAVEGEVYAFSSLFTAVVFWLILKWERVADRPGSDRWLILIAYLMGLSIGVHLLNLLTIPAIVLVYYFKKYTPTWKGTLIALVASVAILGFTQYGIIPGFTTVAAKFELFFVNTLGMPFNSGMFIYLALMIGAICWSIYESYAEKNYLRMTLSFILAVTLVGVPFIGESLLIGLLVIGILVGFFYFKKKKVSARWLNTSMLMIAVMLIGYSTYAVIMIRSAADPTMDQNSPDNVFALKYYLNREQYGDRPLLFGGTYNAPPKVVEDGNYIRLDVTKKPLYTPQPKTNPSDKDRYVIAGYRMDVKQNDNFMMLFPRMYSDEALHVSGYKMWANVKGTPITYMDPYTGQEKTENKPTFGENLKFFIDYQVNFMYWRYLMWNFSGRQNDIQGNGEIEHGNWITGIGFIDNMLVGDQKNLPAELKNNKGHNVYYLLPFILAMLGIFFLLNTDKKGMQGFWITLLLFLMTGLAIVLYLNQTPYQPRERDYAYAGSFYAFSIWIGLGVLGLIQLLNKVLPKNISAGAVTIACLGVPVLMAAQNWDDHDRSGRYTMRDFGQNYLMSCKPNAIIFTNGDNDTFPLWYNQEVEGVRTDVRVCNLSYLQTDWYIDQMKRGAYESAPLPISWTPDEYIEGKNDVVSAEDALQGKALDMNTAFDFLLSKDPSTKMDGDGFFPSRQLYLPINKEEIIKTNTLPASKADSIVPQMFFNLDKRVTKSSIMMLEMLRTNQWKRPMYIATTVGDDYYPKSFNNYVESTGLANHIVPMRSYGDDRSVNVDEMYDNMMNKFKFGGIENPKVYIDENIMRMCHTHRMLFANLVDALIQKGDTARAKKALEYCEKMIPAKTVPHNDYISTLLGQYYYQLGMFAEGNKILDAVAKNNVEYLTWYTGLTRTQQNISGRNIEQNMALLNHILQLTDEAKQKTLFDKYIKPFERFANYYNMRAK